MKKFFFVVFLAVAQVAFAKPRHSGIAGHSIITVCPVIIDGFPCPQHPFPTTFDVLDEKGQFLKNVATQDDGTFVVYLAPGTYTIVPSNAPNCLYGPCSVPQTVRVKNRHFTRVIVGYTIPAH